MSLDLRNVQTCWINLDSAKANATAMEEQFATLGFLNTCRISAKVIPPPKIPSNLLRSYGKHFVGCGQSHIDALESVKQTPLLILEDDALVTDAFRPVISFPDDTDAIYLGISHGNKNQKIVETYTGWYRISGMLATHAILYVSERYRQHSISCMKECIYKRKIPIDLGLSLKQKDYKILATPFPMFIQADSRDSQHKWESLTNKRLYPTHQMVGGTIGGK